MPADLKTLAAEVVETVPYPVLGVPSGVVMRDWYACEVPLQQSQLMGGHSSDGKASTPVIRICVWLVAFEFYGVGICVSYDMVRVPDTRTSWDIDNPMKGIRSKVLFLASPKLDDLDVIARRWGRHITVWLWDSVSSSSSSFLFGILTKRADDGEVEDG
jgi:hypothetical protein